MAYQALYRKFRPQDFGEVYGQEHIVTTLKNQLNGNRIGHAYVFSGTRGTGKTTVAKIFAKALNCENLSDGNPCGQCPSCKKIAEGSSLNVLEVDGASNNGVENIRQIIEDVAYPPVEGAKKVYIIDEAHMVTTAAFNALLKTIEEPPEYAVFILATTEVNKIPITIRSRCQRYDFHRITVEDIAGRMEELRIAEGLTVEPRALKYIARLADGSMRDALSIFDQCISYYFGQEITYDMTLNMLGTADTSMFSALYRAINNHDAKTAVEIAGDAIIRGMEPETFVSDFTWYLRNLLLVKNGQNLEDVADISSEDAKSFMEEVDVADDDFIMRCISVLSELLPQLRFSLVKRVTMETSLIRLCRPQMDRDYQALVDRVRAIEQGQVRVAVATEPVQIRANAEPERVVTTAEPESKKISEPQPEAETKVDNIPAPQTFAPSSSNDNLSSLWDAFIASLREPARSMTTKGVVVQDEPGKARIFFEKKSAGAGFYSNKNNVEKLAAAVDKFLASHCDIQVVVAEPNEMPKASENTTVDATEEFFRRAQTMGVEIEIQD